MIVPVPLKNTGRRNLRILGSAGRCGPSGCIDAVNLPVDAPASSTVVIDVEIRAPDRPGDFTLPLTLFTDDPGRIRLPLILKGRVGPGPAPSSLGINGNESPNG